MSWRDGLEMRSVISTTALSIHYLHLYKFWRCFGGYDYLSGSAREANSAWLLCRYLHRRHHPRLFQQFHQRITSTTTLLNFLWYMRTCKLLQSSQFNHIQSLFDSDFFFSFEKSTFLATKLHTQSQASIPSTYVLLPLILPRHSSLRVLRSACIFTQRSLFLTALTRVFTTSSTPPNCSSPAHQQKLQVVS